MSLEVFEYIEENNLNFLFILDGEFWYETWRGKMISLKEIEKKVCN
jgi:hypothetical protein